MSGSEGDDVAVTTQVATFSVDGHLFGIDVQHVQEVLRPQPLTLVPLAHPAVRGLINLRGQVITAIDLRRQLQLPEADQDDERMNVVVRCHGEAFALLVDEIGDVLEVDQESFEPVPVNVDGPPRELLRGTHSLDRGLLLLLDEQRATFVTNSESLTA
ncbi:MAG: chemotaxis protein CheW [Acidobacteriota bacterium]